MSFFCTQNQMPTGGTQCLKKTVQKEPGKKPVPSKKPKPQQEVVVQISLSELHPFPDHPFQVREDASMQETAESVKEYGVLVPALAWPRYG
jgi:ParB family chromosome partitioning protein